MVINTNLSAMTGAHRLDAHPGKPPASGGSSIDHLNLIFQGGKNPGNAALQLRSQHVLVQQPGSTIPALPFCFWLLGLQQPRQQIGHLAIAQPGLQAGRHQRQSGGLDEIGSRTDELALTPIG